MVLKLAARNIWRNKRRTLLSVLALALGVAAIVGFHSFREAAEVEMLRGLTSGLVGHLQVHGRGYQAAPEIGNVVPDAAAVESGVREALPQAQVEPRVIGAGLAGAGDTSAPVMVMGIEPRNPAVRALLTIDAGRALSASPANEVVLGSSLARALGLPPGGELVLVGQAADGSLANDRFRVVGTADAGSSEANETAVFLHLADAQSFFALGGGVHQLIVRLPTDEEDLSHPASLLRGAVDVSRLEVMAWDEILPELKGALDAKRRNSRLINLIVFLIVALGVLNTMTMSTFERTREFGVMASLGTRRRRILGMVLLEALLQGLIGFAAGLFIAWAFLHAIGTAELGGLVSGDMLGAPMPATLRLSVMPGPVAAAALTALLTVVAGGLVPAIRASRLKPVEATRYV